MSKKNFLRKIFILVLPKLFLKLRYKRVFGFFPDLKNPKRFTEKIMYRIIYDHNPQYTYLADKVLVRDWINKKLKKEEGGGRKDEFFPKCYGIWNDVEKIDFKTLPKAFVLKSNHASGHIILCTNKDKLDMEQTKKIMKKWMKTNYYYEYGEWHYKNIKPQIICEELLDGNIIDYRFFCFKGEVAFIRATIHDSKSPSKYAVGSYTKNWEKTDIKFGDNDQIIDFDKPKQLDKMIHLAEIFSKDFSFVRVDLYNVNEKVYFSEMTFTPCGGGYRVTPDEWDFKLGDMFKLQ